jgi:hypothetical protein
MYLQGKEDDYAKPKVAYKLVQDIVKQDLIKKASVPLGLEYSMDIVLMDFDEFIRLKECERRLKELQPQSSPKKGDDPDA